jgi:hypothetical protein
LSRMNIHSTDPSLSVGGGVGPALSPGEIAAAVVMSPPKMPITCRYVSQDVALQLLDALLFAKYAMDLAATLKLNQLLFAHIGATVMLNSEPDMKKLRAEIVENRGAMRNMCAVAIDDICKPQKYLHLSARGWAREIGLANHKQWQGRWEGRYRNVLAVLQELDAVIVRQIERRI